MWQLKTYVIVLACLAIPAFASAQGPAESIHSLNGVLDKLFDEMLPLCKKLIVVGQAIGGFAALSYIGLRAWKHIARAEAIDFFPLLRPFAIGLAIMLFPSVIALMNGVLKPTVTATQEMAGDSKRAIYRHIEQQAESIYQSPPPGISPGGDPSETDKYEQPESGSGFLGMSAIFSWFNIKSMFKVMVTEFVQIIYAAASLCINTIRTFYLIILAILGPIVFALSIFDGFQHTLASWFARYINVFMWLPVANIFSGINGKILENMMTLDQNFFSGVAYIIFMLISIVGYFTVPNVASYIIQAGGRDTLLHKVNQYAQQGAKAAAKMLI